MAFLTAAGMAMGALGTAKQFFDGKKLKREAEAGLAEFTEQEFQRFLMLHLEWMPQLLCLCLARGSSKVNKV